MFGFEEGQETEEGFAQSIRGSVEVSDMMMSVLERNSGSVNDGK